jgi:hypothetical protein
MVLEDGSVYANAIRIAGNSVIEEGVKIYGTLVMNELIGYENENNEAIAGLQYSPENDTYRLYKGFADGTDYDGAEIVFGGGAPLNLRSYVS